MATKTNTEVVYSIYDQAQKIRREENVTLNGKRTAEVAQRMLRRINGDHSLVVSSVRYICWA